MKHRHSKYLPGFTLLCDLILLNLAYLILKYAIAPETDHSLPIFILAGNIVWAVISPFSKIYVTPRPLLVEYSIEKFMEILIVHICVILALMYGFGKFYISPIHLLITYCAFILLVAGHRFLLSLALNFIRMSGYNIRNILMLGDEETVQRLTRHFAIHPEYGYDLIRNPFENSLDSYSHDEITTAILKDIPDEIFLCYNKIDQELVSYLIDFGATYSIKIKLVSDMLLKQKYARIVNYDDLPVMYLKNVPTLGNRLKFAKRSFDILFSSTVLVITSPLLATLYIITKATSRGPAWYLQERVGLHGKAFKIIKFRSMYVDAEQAGPQLAKHGDPRVTPWGRIIRKTRLDELPQFWNVLKGDMSVVGPRPERQHFIERIVEKTPHYGKLQVLKPGITSMGQVYYGYAENVDQMCERLEYDLLYLQHISFSADLRLIAHTVRVMIQGKGK